MRRWSWLGNLAVFMLLWAALWGTLDPVMLLAGAGIGLFALRALSRVRPISGGLLPPARWGTALRLLVSFLWALLVSTGQVVIEVLRPPSRYRMDPAVLSVDCSEHGDDAALILANGISLTPGTVSLELERPDDRLYIHAMYGREPEGVRRMVERTFQRFLRRMLPPPPGAPPGRES